MGRSHLESILHGLAGGLTSSTLAGRLLFGDGFGLVTPPGGVDLGVQRRAAGGMLLVLSASCGRSAFCSGPTVVVCPGSVFTESEVLVVCGLSPAGGRLSLKVGIA